MTGKMKMASSNMGYLVTGGLLTREEHGYSHRIRNTGVYQPNIQRSRGWETKLGFALKRIEKAEARADAFEGKLLADMELSQSRTPALNKHGKPRKLLTPEELITNAEKSVLALEKTIGEASIPVARAKKAAILAEDQHSVEVAEQALADISGKAKGIKSRIRELRKEYSLDSSL